MVGNVTIQGQIVGTATFDGAKISAVVTIAPPINATVVFGKSGVSVHNELTGRDAVDAHPKESITGLTISDSPEFADIQITTLDSVANGGIIDTTEATWLGATAKSVLSCLQKLVSKVFSIDSRVGLLEDNVIADITISNTVSYVDIKTDTHGNPLSLKDNTRVQIEMFIIAPDVGPCWIHLNGISALGQYSFSNSAGNGLYFIRGIPARVSMNVSIMAQQTQAMMVVSRPSGAAFNNASVVSATLPVYSGGLVSTPITSLRFTGVFLSGTKIRITKC